MFFIMLRYFLSILILSSVLIINRCYVFSNDFLSLLKWLNDFILFFLLIRYWFICKCWTILVSLEWTHLVFDLLLFNLVFLHLYSSEILVCSFIFCVCIFLARLWYHGNDDLIKCVRKYCFTFKFFKEFEEDRY